MAYVIASNPDASYLCGKPTIPGSIKGLTLDTIASFAYDAYHPQRNPKLNPCRKNLLIPKKGVQVLGALPFSKMVAMHNRRMKKIGGPKILYKPKMSVEEKYLIAQQLLLLGSGTSFDHDKFRLPPMFNLYTRLVQDDGMVVIGDAVINDIYINEASEFPFLLQTNKKSSMHTIFLQHYAQLLVK